MLCLSVYTKNVSCIQLEYALTSASWFKSVQLYKYDYHRIMYLPHFSLTLTISITDLKGSVHLRCADTFFLCLLQDTDKLHKKLLGGDKFITSQVDR